MKPVPAEPKLSHLYQEVILDHNRKPRNFKEIADATQYSQGINPLCGDNYQLYLKIDNEGVVADAGFTGSGCAISKASASMMTSLIKGKHQSEAAKIKDAFLDLMVADDLDAERKRAVGRLILFEGVKEFPVRVKCATLAWHALADALKDAVAGKKKALEDEQK